METKIIRRQYLGSYIEELLKNEVIQNKIIYIVNNLNRKVSVLLNSHLNDHLYWKSIIFDFSKEIFVLGRVSLKIKKKSTCNFE